MLDIFQVCLGGDKTILNIKELLLSYAVPHVVPVLTISLFTLLIDFLVSYKLRAQMVNKSIPDIPLKATSIPCSILLVLIAIMVIWTMSNPPPVMSEYQNLQPCLN